MARHVLTVATNREGYFEFFLQSCKRHNITPVVIGEGEPWNGYGTKFKLMRDWVANIDDADCVLLVDCYDLIFVRDIEPLFGAFEHRAAGRSNYIYAASESSDIFAPIVKMFHGTHKGAIINSGSFMAYGKFLKTFFNDSDILQELSQNPRCDDQQMLIKYMNSHPEIECELDGNVRFIVYQNMGLHVGSRLHIDEDRVVTYRVNDNICSEPYLIHRCNNGSLITLLQKLGYDTKYVDTSSNHFARMMTIHLPNYANHFSNWVGSWFK